MSVGRPIKYLTEEERQKSRIKQAIEWRKNNREKYLENERKRRSKNFEKIKNNDKKWREKNKEVLKQKRRLYLKKRKENNPIFKIEQIVRGNIRRSFSRGIKNFIKRERTERILGCSIDFFVSYILSKCPQGTSIENFGRYGYHLDHIIPISKARTDKEIIRLCHYTNFQPLWWKDNLKKSDKIYVKLC